METIRLGHNVNVFNITAKSFPGGIMDAEKALLELTPFSAKRINNSFSSGLRPQGLLC